MNLLTLGPLHLDHGFILTADDKCVGEVRHWYGIPESVAYGRAFAAAPELLDVLQRAAVCLSRVQDRNGYNFAGLIADADAAIGKATGGR